jgi:hypothetical protein
MLTYQVLAIKVIYHFNWFQVICLLLFQKWWAGEGGWVLLKVHGGRVMLRDMTADISSPNN